MKLKYVILFAIILTACTLSSDHATDSQVNWCYKAAEELQIAIKTLYSDPELKYDDVYDFRLRSLERSYIATMNLYEQRTGKSPMYTKDFISGLNTKNTDSMKFCKIFADMENID